MKRMMRVLLSMVLLAGLAMGQTATVKRNVNLRSDASADSDILEKLKPPAQLQLLEADPTDGFYHVQAPDGQTGYVWGKNIHIEEGVGPAPTPGPTPTPTPAPTPGPSPAAGDLFSRLMAARKTATGQPLLVNGVQVCGPEGDTSNPQAQALNDNKNRTDLPADADYVEISWDDLQSLPANRVSDFQGAPVKVVGFLSHQVKVENGGESTNCHLHADAEVDWHIYLTKSSAQGIQDAIIIETTPRTRPMHRWTTDMLAPLVDSQTQVRISGWLMYDSEHVNVIGTQRATVWEVHPITRIEVQQNGQWVDLDAQP